MNTSYYGSPKLEIIDRNKFVAVSYTQPEFFKGIRIYKPLCPSWNLVNDYKTGIIDSKLYTEFYYMKILNKLDCQETFDALGDFSTLLCYEKSGDFCHRRIIADWFKKILKIEVNEL